MALVFAVMHLYNFYHFYCFCPFPFYINIYILKSCIGKWTEWSTIAEYHSLMCSFNRGNTEQTHSSKTVCDVCVCMFYLILRQD